MKDTYKGYEITYIEHNETFTAKIGQSSYDNKSLSVVKKYIDNLDKKDFKRVNVIVDNYTGYELIIEICRLFMRGLIKPHIILPNIL